jgi:hypothetical protein
MRTPRVECEEDKKYFQIQFMKFLFAFNLRKFSLQPTRAPDSALAEITCVGQLTLLGRHTAICPAEYSFVLKLVLAWGL